jgi:O-antigen ligase
MVLAAWPRLEGKAQKFIAGFIFLAAVFLLIFGWPVIARFSSSFDLAEGSNSGRLLIWQDSWEVFKKSPVTGAGLGNYSLALNFASDYRNSLTSHNLYLDLLAELGVFGLLVWLWFYGSALKQLQLGIKSCFPAALGVLGALTYFFIHSFFETAIFNPTVLAFLMIILGLTLSLKNCEDFNK